MNKLRRSKTDRSIQCVCGGLGAFFGISPLAIRIIFLITLPVSLVVYLILAYMVDEEPTKLYD